uniref:Retrotransposon gag domain-containing protein n=1 Tax=Anopheles epiroticus TaxID=199890 RepID=A0A182PWV2_9DIPT
MSDSENESFAAATAGLFVTERKKTDNDEVAALKKMVTELQQKLEQALQQPKAEEERKVDTATASACSERKANAESGGTMCGRSEVWGRVPDIRELREVIQPFDPKDASCPDAAKWLENLEETSEVYGWSEAVKLHCARLSLRGCAKLWWEGVQTTTKTWREFKTALVMGFPTSKNQAFYHNWLSARKWRTEETATEYVYEMVAMGRKGDFSEETTTSYIVNGLSEMWRRARVAVGRVTTVEDLLKEISWVEGIEAAAGQG